MPEDDYKGYFFCDLETGGLEAHHAILQVGAIITDLEFNVQATFSSYVKPPPGLVVEDGALKANKICRKFIPGFPEERFVARSLHSFIAVGEFPLRFAGFNCPFDLGMLDLMKTRVGILEWGYKVPEKEGPLDLLTECRKRYKELPSRSLDAMRAHFGYSSAGAHDALQDTYATLRIARKFFGGKTHVS